MLLSPLDYLEEIAEKRQGNLELNMDRRADDELLKNLVRKSAPDPLTKTTTTDSAGPGPRPSTAPPTSSYSAPPAGPGTRGIACGLPLPNGGHRTSSIGITECQQIAGAGAAATESATKPTTMARATTTARRRHWL